jgi:hypothetical protein
MLVSNATAVGAADGEVADGEATLFALLFHEAGVTLLRA